MRPSELVREWVARFNTADAGGLAELYADSAAAGSFTYETA
jgi:ketosteroid isomerase-like protein